MARNVIEGGFRSSKMATGSHFVKKKEKNQCDRKGFLVIQNGCWQPFCEQNPPQKRS